MQPNPMNRSHATHQTAGKAQQAPLRLLDATRKNPELTGGCWPTPQQELLLQAALAPEERAFQAWLQWNREADLIEDTLDLGTYRLLPLVYYNLRRRRTEGPHLERLRGIHRRTWVENQSLIHACSRLLEAFHRAHIDTMVLKGAALLAHYYPDHGVRPMGDIDIWVPLDQVEQAIGILAARQWLPQGRTLEQLTTHYFSIQHGHGFFDPENKKLDLHWHILHSNLDSRVDTVLWQGAVPVQIADISTRALNATDQLLHICVHGAAWNSTPPVRWVADAAMILQHPKTTIDWTRLQQLAVQGRCTLQLHATLDYLARTLSLPIPKEIIAGLTATPVDAQERRSFEINTRRSKGLGNWPKLWNGYREYRRRMQAASGRTGFTPLRTLTFPGYLRVDLGRRNWLDLGGWFVSRTLKRLVMKLTHKD